MADSRKKEKKERQKTKELRRENRAELSLRPKRLSYIKFRADIKNQRRKCCIRDAAKEIRTHTKKEKKEVSEL